MTMQWNFTKEEMAQRIIDLERQLDEPRWADHLRQTIDEDKVRRLIRERDEAIERGVRVWYRGRVLYHQGYVQAIDEIQEAFKPPKEDE